MFHAYSWYVLGETFYFNNLSLFLNRLHIFCFHLIDCLSFEGLAASHRYVSLAHLNWGCLHIEIGNLLDRFLHESFGGFSWAFDSNLSFLLLLSDVSDIALD